MIWCSGPWLESRGKNQEGKIKLKTIEELLAELS